MSDNPPDESALEQRRRDFFAHFVEPMVAEAREIDVPVTEIIMQMIQQHSLEDEE
ncbi:hypothetical protein [Amycolatopsis anabasis]|uniref:hypothetical protein n=1 Tax=Amycolatopsis anabasis TaxID=1840409 RepID=UPI00131EB4AC|nr:hypothetical protein [Amycolatopsis anabasis]